MALLEGNIFLSCRHRFCGWVMHRELWAPQWFAELHTQHQSHVPPTLLTKASWTFLPMSCKGTTCTTALYAKSSVLSSALHGYSTRMHDWGLPVASLQNWFPGVRLLSKRAGEGRKAANSPLLKIEDHVFQSGWGVLPSLLGWVQEVSVASICSPLCPLGYCTPPQSTLIWAGGAPECNRVYLQQF